MNESNYPKQQFGFVIIGADEHIKSRIVTDLESFVQRPWLIAAPTFVIDSEDSSILEVDLTVYSAHDVQLPKEIDQAHFEEVRFLIGWLQLLSAEYSLEIECYLDQTFVGSISAGLQDDLLSDGLLGEWERHLLVSK